MDYNYQKYEKMPVWKWAAVYLGVAAVVYGLVYYATFGQMNTQYDPSAPQGVPQQQNPAYQSY